MTVTLEVPEEFARLMADDAGGLPRAAFEALVLEDGFLKAHDILLPLTAEEVARDAETALLHRSNDRRYRRHVTD